jgi:hypothetical protein
MKTMKEQFKDARERMKTMKEQFKDARERMKTMKEQFKDALEYFFRVWETIGWILVILAILDFGGYFIHNFFLGGR